MFKLIGGIIGLINGGFWGALIGVFVGHIIDSFSRIKVTATHQRTTSHDFTHTLLILTAEVMKADDKLLKSELYYIKNFFVQNFGSTRANMALMELKEILKEEHDVQEVCRQFRLRSSIHERLLLIQFLFGLAASDGEFGPEEIHTIDQIASWCGISEIDYQSLKSMYMGGNYRSSSSSAYTTSYQNLDLDYKVLEINNTATDEEVKKAYRNMAKKHHPDKVNHLGEEMRKAAEEKFARLNQAYERIRKSRGMA